MKYFLYMYVDLSILMSWLQISSFKKDSITIVTYISTWKIETKSTKTDLYHCKISNEVNKETTSSASSSLLATFHGIAP